MSINFTLWNIAFAVVGALVFNVYYWSILVGRYGRLNSSEKAWRFATLRLILFWIFLVLPVVLAYIALNNYFSRLEGRSTIMPMILIAAYLLTSFLFQSVIMVRFDRYTGHKL